MSAAAARLAPPGVSSHGGGATAALFADDRLHHHQFDRIAAAIHDACGIAIPRGKATMLEGRLRRRARALGFGSLAEYDRYLFDEADPEEELVELINAVTTNKTDFFREPAHFTFLERTLLPQWQAQRRRRIRVWSAACANGAEPYTLAMVLDAARRAAIGPDWAMLATDIDTEMLAAAKRAVYPAEMLAPVPAAMRERYVLGARNPARHEARIVPELRASIGFARLNLIDPAYPVGEPMDVIFLRNVLIYFDRPTQRRIVAQMAACLAPGGYLFLGHSEAALGADPALESVASAVFARR